jgi:hypothetical protein
VIGRGGLCIRPDVAAVKVRQRPVTLDGRAIEGQNEGGRLYVMAKEHVDGGWSPARAPRFLVT